MASARRTNKSPKRAKATADQWEIARRDSLYVIETFRLSYEPLRPDHVLFDDEDIIVVEEVLHQYYSWDVGKRALDLALKTLEQTQWVSVDQPRASDFDRRRLSRSQRPKRVWHIGTDIERTSRATLLAKVDQLEVAVAQYRNERGGFGHNRPPTLDVEEDGPPPIEPIENAISEIRQALHGIGDPEASIRNAQRKIRAWVGMWNWIKEKADRAVNSVVDQAGSLVKCIIIAAAIPGSVSTLRSCGDTVVTVAKDVGFHAEHWLNTASTVAD